MGPGHSELAFASPGDDVPGAYGSAVPGGRVAWRRVFPGVPGQVPAARRWVLAVLAGRLVDGEAAECIAAEYIANAIVHTSSGAPGGQVTVLIGADDCIHVHDQAGVPDPVREAPLSGLLCPREGGNGLRLVMALSSGWGFTPPGQCTAGGSDDPARGGCAWAFPLPAGPGARPVPPPGPAGPGGSSTSAARPACGIGIAKGNV